MSSKIAELLPQSNSADPNETAARVPHIVNSEYKTKLKASSAPTPEPALSPKPYLRGAAFANSSNYPAAMGAARNPADSYSPVPKPASPFPYDSNYPFAPPADDIPQTSSRYPIALRRASDPAEIFTPVKAPVTPAHILNLPTTMRLAPIIITDAQGPDEPPARANALSSVDPSLVKAGHFDRPLIGYQVLRDMIAEAERPGIETLRQAIAASYKTNPRLSAERTRLKETDEAYIQARAQGRPNASASADLNYALRRTPDTGRFAAAGSFETETGHPRDAQVQISQPLYQGGRIKALKSRAKFGIMAGRERLRDAEQSIALSAAAAYADLLRDREIAQIRREDLRIILRLEQAAKDRFETGVGTRTDVFQAKARAAQSEIRLAQSEAQLSISLAAYDRIIGYPPLNLAAIPALNIPASPEAAIKIARANNPRFRAAARDFNASFAAIKIADALGSPTLALIGTASAERGQFTGLDRRDAVALALQLRVPFYSGGTNTSRKREAIAVKDRQYYEALETERTIVQAISEHWAAHDAAKSSYENAKAQTRFAQAAYDGVKDEQLFGQRDVLDVLNQQAELQNARAQETIAARNIHIAAFRLLNTMGVFDAYHLGLPTDLYDVAKNLNAIAHSKYSPREPEVVIDDWIEAAPTKDDLPTAPPF